MIAYSAIDHTIHGVESGYPATSASATPVTGCTTTAVAVNIRSAKTTSLPTAAIIFGSRDRCARKKKKAMPAPVPNRIVDEMMCTHLINEYQGIIGGSSQRASRATSIRIRSYELRCS